MSIVRTDKWLDKHYDKPAGLCEKLRKYFHGTHAEVIHTARVQHGMYRYPVTNGAQLMTRLRENNVWETVQKEENQLQPLWDGPDIPVFIFPADTTNRQLK